MEDKKGKRGRPVSVDITGDRREVVKNIRFSKKEWDAVHQKMMECEMHDFSEYARLACLQLDPVIFDVESFASLLYINRLLCYCIIFFFFLQVFSEILLTLLTYFSIIDFRR